MLKVLCNIISEKIDDGSYAYKPGNVLYFSMNRNACTAIMFTNSTPVVKTSPIILFENDEDIKYKHLYTKLFDDRLVQRFRRTPNKYQDFYMKEYVEELRKEAKGRYSHFLKTKMKDYDDFFPFGDQFFAMLVPIACRMGSRGSPQNLPVRSNLDIPFAACIKFAFDGSQTGKVTALCGEVGTKSAKERAKSIKNTAEELIKW